MLHCIGTVKEIRTVADKFHEDVIAQLYHCTKTLDDAYGAERDCLKSGGYSLIAENEEDVADVRQIIDIDKHPCEWADSLGGGFLSALYLLNDDFSVVVFMPIALAPPTLLSELED